MQIRFKKFTPCGPLQLQAGELLDLPASIAQAHIDAGNAVAVPKAEFAVMPRQNAPAFPTRKPSKARR